MSNPGDLCQLADLQNWLPTAPPDSANAELQQLISAASGLICRYTGRSTFAPTAYADTYDGNGKNWMLLRQWPVISITSIALTEWGSTTSINVSDPTQFQLEAPIPVGGNQRLTLTATPYAVFPRGRGNVQIAYQAGWTTIPYEVVQACVEIAGEAYQRRNRIGQVSVTSQGQTTVSFSQRDMPAPVAQSLQPYIRRVPI